MVRPPILDALQRRIADLDARIGPLLPRFDPGDPDLRAKIAAAKEKRGTDVHPSQAPVLDRGDFRDEAEALLDDILAAFVTGTTEDRDALRAMFRQFKQFAWAIAWAGRLTVAKDTPLTAELCRTKLAFIALQDQGPDPRDAILAVQGLCAAAQRSALPVASLLSEAAARASDEARYAAVGAGSTRALLLAYAERYRR